MYSYLDNEDMLLQCLKEKISMEFVDRIVDAIQNKKLINYNDELPRHVLIDFKLDNKTMIFCFENDIHKIINYQGKKVVRSNSSSKKFFLKNDKDNDELMIVFDCNNV